MFQPLLFGGALFGALTTPTLQAEQAPVTPTQAVQPGQTPAWVEGHRERFAAPQAPRPPAMVRAPQRVAPPWPGAPYPGWGQPYPPGYNGWQPGMGDNWGDTGWNQQ